MPLGAADDGAGAVDHHDVDLDRGTEQHALRRPPRARRDRVTVTHSDASGTGRFVVPPGTSISPGDTVLVGERWF